MKQRNRNITAPKKHLFTNIAVCGDCGTGMWYRQNRKGYICGGYGRHGIKKCSHHTVKEVDLKILILSDLQKYAMAVSNEGVIEKLEEQAMKVEKTITKKLISIDKDIKQLADRKNKFLHLLAYEVITKAEYLNVIEDTSKIIQSLTSKKAELQCSLNNSNVKEEITKIKAELDKYLLFKELTEEMLHRFVSKIEIKADGTPKIFYRFSTPTA